MIVISPVFEGEKALRGAGIARHEGNRADCDVCQLEKLLGYDDGADGVGVQVLSEVIERPGKL